MFTYNGIAVDAWARIEGRCPISCEVIGNEAQFEIGTNVASLNLVITEDGLEKLLAAAAKALALLRADEG
ncbi:hypothetical protein [Amycolatopsis anabasis]|uniref:hypothetical protein n=1 Tax=Amycolatopsis anabasis TaxID=1840409 RepID=UPI00131C311A|nr:hypothetical protein [Amycolatopsis anabasis]